MCTVTIVPARCDVGAGADGFRLVCNRDEARTRPSGIAPVERSYGGLSAIHPVDPLSGGTWIAVNSAGLVFALLNATPTAMGPTIAAARASRGLIIPSLLGCATLPAVTACAATMAAGHYQPFRLIAAHHSAFVEIRSDGEQITVQPMRTIESPLLFASSGLGDAVVDGPRRELFARMVVPRRDWAAQDEYHAHCWPERTHLSVCMSRADARTVSRTIVLLQRGEVHLTYFPNPTAPDAHVRGLMLRSTMQPREAETCPR